MCGRFTLTRTLRQLQERFDIPDEGLQFDPEEYRPNPNIAPTEMVPAVASIGGNRIMFLMKWGLIPTWAKDPRIGARMINARSDTLHEKQAFKGLIEDHTCLIPADGFIEFEKVGKTKRPIRFIEQNQGVFAFAGLWSPGSPSSCTIITTEPNLEVRTVHDRMPVILGYSEEDAWLVGATGRKNQLLRPAPDGRLKQYYVNPGINSVRQKSTDLLDAYSYEEDLFSGN